MATSLISRRVALLWLSAFLLAADTVPAAQPTALQEHLAPFVECLLGQRPRFALSGAVTVSAADKDRRADFNPRDGRKQMGELRLERLDEESFSLEISYGEDAVRIERCPERTTLTLPRYKVAFVGTGANSGADSLDPARLAARLISTDSLAGVFLPLIANADAKTVAAALMQLAALEFDPQAGVWVGANDVKLSVEEEGPALKIRRHNIEIRVAIAEDDIGTCKAADGIQAPDDWKTVSVNRAELERHLVRGTRRALEILVPGPTLTNPSKQAARVPHGELRWIDGCRVVTLRGTPEQVGRAHGELLKSEMERCRDSVLYLFGTVQTVRSGRWFPHDLEAAYERLKKHIPEDHKAEIAAMAEAAGLEPAVAQAMNVFPELFHCSGFAVFGKATKDGTLYHGRVLDYMTTIGLQDAATTFVVAIDKKIPFVNVGYAGFTGSVTGMNREGVSLGEMGGRGEGEWDGVPMATLMRRALEECRTIDEVAALWKNSPRTCEYYYVFADGKTNAALGVAATPETLEFIAPGQSHDRLGEGIEDAVVLSAGERLETLRSRVKSRYGQIDIETALWLMSRPVAMQSNLHNVLFVPAQGILYVANADHHRPAAERPYTRLDLKKLLEGAE